jgi:hypothetical protein
MIQAKILEAYEEELRKSKQPGYVSPSVNDDEEYFDDFIEVHPEEEKEGPKEEGWNKKETDKGHGKNKEQEDSFDAGIFT